MNCIKQCHFYMDCYTQGPLKVSSINYSMISSTWLDSEKHQQLNITQQQSLAHIKINQASILYNTNMFKNQHLHSSNIHTFNYFAHRSSGEVLWWARLCVSVCLSTSISPEPQARSLPICLCMLPMAVVSPPPAAWWNPKKGQFWVFRNDNALHSTAQHVQAFGTPYKNDWTDRHAIWDFGIMTSVGHGYYMLNGDQIPQREGAVWGKTKKVK